MTRLFGRQWYLSVGSLDLSELDISFRVERSIRREPNTAEIRVWNLAPASRATVEAGGIVALRAGYEDPPRIFRGDTRAVWTAREGPDHITTIQARDGGRAYAETRIARAYAPGTPVTRIVRDVVSDMDIGEGNLGEFSSAFRLRNGTDAFGDGYVAQGPARRVLNDLCRAAGLRWSVQNGALQIMRQGVPLQSRSTVLAADSGLIESPMWDERGIRSQGRRGTVTCKSLLQAGIDPGRKVYLESALITGDFEVRAQSIVGDTRANDWTSTLTLRPVS